MMRGVIMKVCLAAMLVVGFIGLIEISGIIFNLGFRGVGYERAREEKVRFLSHLETRRGRA